MKLTKFQHACFTVEKDDTVLIVDPGTFSHDFIIPHKVDGIIITHEHPDHLDPKIIEKILVAHPKAAIIGHESITAKYSNSPTLAVQPGQTYTLGSFALQFFGGAHAPIAEGITTPPNLGVLIDTSLYYPGDSFSLPIIDDILVPVKTLALPVSAPWLDFARTRDYLDTVQPELTFPTHDGILSEDGKQLAATMVGGFAESKGIVYKRLDDQTIVLS